MQKGDGVPILLSTVKAAEELGVTLRTLYRFIDEGTLPAYRFGRVIRLKAVDVSACIEAHRVEPGDLAHLYPPPTSREPEAEPV